MILTREEIIKMGAARKVEKVKVPEWKGDVYVREITAGEYDTLQMAAYTASQTDAQPQVRANWVAAFCCDADGNRIFQDADIKTISAMGAKAVDRIYEAGQKLNALDEADELEKN